MRLQPVNHIKNQYLISFLPMNYLAVIPARYDSTRFPGKPLADIAGKPMIQRVYERVAEYFDACCVATDDERIMRAVELFGGTSVMTSYSHKSGTDRCAEALDIMEQKKGTKFDIIVNVQGDEPFVSFEHLRLIREAFESADTQIATLVKRFSDGEDIFNPNTPKVAVSGNMRALYFSRSVIPYLRGKRTEEWTGAFPFMKHIGLYAYRSDVLREITKLPQGELETAESLEQLRWLENGYTVDVRVTTAESLAVDTPEDLERIVASM